MWGDRQWGGGGTETGTWVSTSEDRGGRAQAVKLGEVLFGRTVGGTEQLKATWRGETQTDMNTDGQMEGLDGGGGTTHSGHGWVITGLLQLRWAALTCGGGLGPGCCGAPGVRGRGRVRSPGVAALQGGHRGGRPPRVHGGRRLRARALRTESTSERGPSLNPACQLCCRGDWANPRAWLRP